MSDVECLSWFRSSGFQSVVSSGSQKSRGCVILFHPSLLLVVLCRVSFVSRINRFVSFPCRHQIITLQETSFLSRSPPGSTHRSLLSYVVTSIRLWLATTQTNKRETKLRGVCRSRLD